MPKEYSPFTPGAPVPIDFFVGRIEEITQLVTATKKSLARGTIERFFVMGERGIGKSSLCSIAKFIVEKDHPVLGLHVFLGGIKTLEDMMRKFLENLLEETLNKPWYKSIRNLLLKR